MSKRKKYIWVGVIMLLAAGASVCFGAAFTVSLLIAAGIVFGFVAIVAFCMAAQNPSENLSVNIPYHSVDRAEEQGKRAKAGDRVSEQARQTQEEAKVKEDRIFVGKRVWHKHFGRGIVKMIDGKYLTVSFGDGKNRRFIAPDCFALGYLLFHERQTEKSLQNVAAAEKKEVPQKEGIIVTETRKQGVIRRGDVFYCRTNVELLNKLLGKHFAGFMKGHYPLTETYEIMLHEFDKVTTAKWLNQELSDGEVLELFVGDVKVFRQHDELPEKRRALFEKRREEGVFIFKGVYQLCEESTVNRRVWERIADETNLYDF